MPLSLAHTLQQGKWGKLHHVLKHFVLQGDSYHHYRIQSKILFRDQWNQSMASEFLYSSQSLDLYWMGKHYSSTRYSVSVDYGGGQQSNMSERNLTCCRYLTVLRSGNCEYNSIAYYIILIRIKLLSELLCPVDGVDSLTVTINHSARHCTSLVIHLWRMTQLLNYRTCLWQIECLFM